MKIFFLILLVSAMALTERYFFNLYAVRPVGYEPVIIFVVIFSLMIIAAKKTTNEKPQQA